MGHSPGVRLSIPAAVRRVADDLLRPQAERVDQSRVPRSHVDALAATGALGLGPSPALREVHETLAGACASTWFTVLQHVAPLQALTSSDNAPLQERWLAGLRSGSLLAGIAFAHLRRPVSSVACRPSKDGWVFDGHVPWMTAWGICDLVLIGARHEDSVVFALVRAHDGPGLVASAPLELMAMQATSTVTLDLTRYAVPSADVVVVRPYADWTAEDRDRTADVTAGVFGLQSEAARRLSELAPGLGFRLSGEGDRLRDKAYALAGIAARYEERLEVRAEALDLCLRTATALVVASGGSGMALDRPAQRHLREAAFLQVQAQTPALKALMLDRF